MVRPSACAVSHDPVDRHNLTPGARPTAEPVQFHPHAPHRELSCKVRTYQPAGGIPLTQSISHEHQHINLGGWGQHRSAGASPGPRVVDMPTSWRWAASTDAALQLNRKDIGCSTRKVETEVPGTVSHLQAIQITIHENMHT